MSRFLLLSILGLITSCGQQINNTSYVQSATLTKPVLVISGGFSSCPNDGVLDAAMRAGKTSEMYQQIWKKGIVNRIKKSAGNAPAIFSICYTGPSSLASNFTQSIKGRFAWNLGVILEGRGGTQSFGIPQGEILENISFLSHLKAELHDYIKEVESDGSSVRIYFIGHSYGGFTSIQLADYFAERVVGLATIDAVSMLDCQAKDMATKIYSTLNKKLPGCLHAPSDPFSTKSIARIQNTIKDSNHNKWWFNAYQTTFPWLHSSYINSTSTKSPENEKFVLADFNSAILDGDYHSQMGRNEKVWNSISRRF